MKIHHDHIQEFSKFFRNVFLKLLNAIEMLFHELTIFENSFFQFFFTIMPLHPFRLHEYYNNATVFLTFLT